MFLHTLALFALLLSLNSQLCHADTEIVNFAALSETDHPVPESQQWHAKLPQRMNVGPTYLISR